MTDIGKQVNEELDVSYGQGCHDGMTWMLEASLKEAFTLCDDKEFEHIRIRIRETIEKEWTRRDKRRRASVL